MTRTACRRRVLAALLSALVCGAVFGGVRLAGLSPQELFPFWLWPLAAAGAYAACRFALLPACREKWAGLIFSLLLIFTQLVGRQFDFPTAQGGATAGGLGRAALCLVCAAGLAPALGWPAAQLLRAIGRRADAAPDHAAHSWRTFWLCLLALVLLWQPYHLAYWPGLAEYDSGYQLWQSWNRVYDASNPLFHTFILGFFYLTGEQYSTVNTGLAVFCLLQQVLMAACMAFALATVRRHGAPRWLVALSTLFFGLLPVFGMLSISMTKDVPFYSLVLVQLTLVYDGCRRPEGGRSWRYWAALVLVTCLCCLLRSNALGAMALIPPLMCLGCRSRRFRRGLLAFMLAGTAAAWGVNELLIASVNATRPLMRENLSVPIIQLARVTTYHDDAREDLTANHSGLVEMPMAYIPYVADLAKWKWTVDGSSLGSFLGLWARWGAAYPTDYADALLLVTKGYWYIGDTSYARVYGHTYDQHLGAIPSRVTANIESIEHHCLLPGLYEHLEHMYSANEYLNIPVYRLLLSPALYVWALLLGLAACVCQRRQDARMPARAGLIYLAGLLLGPCCILRYALLFLLLAPVLLGMLLTAPPREQPVNLSGAARHLP